MINDIDDIVEFILDVFRYLDDKVHSNKEYDLKDEIDWEYIDKVESEVELIRERYNDLKGKLSFSHASYIAKKEFLKRLLNK